MNNCYVNLQGGLGNQLFQIAAGYAYARRTHKYLYLNTQHWTAHQGNGPIEYLNTIFKNFEYGEPIFPNQCRTITEDNIFNRYDENVCLDGYFQSLKYFEDYPQSFLRMLHLPNVKTDFIRKKNVAFHIRRGDYLVFAPVHHVCTTAYFQKQFEDFKDYQINVFSDSPKYVLEEFKGHDFNLLQTSSELNDLTLMSKHDNIVCSNSSFSWWASLIGKMEQVIVPDRWFADGRVCEDIYRPDMIRCSIP